MIDHPEFSPAYAVVLVDGEAAYLVSERGHIVIKGTAQMAVARCADDSERPLLQIENRDVQRAAAHVVHQHVLQAGRRAGRQRA